MGDIQWSADTSATCLSPSPSAAEKLPQSGKKQERRAEYTPILHIFVRISLAPNDLHGKCGAYSLKRHRLSAAASSH